ncbi:FAD-binding oxidoreductase [Actinoplanes sichuanensis]|uniref:FAD-binding oxidoreductase n=1 Tax=Actinoplanes sichuanensis TaxID=512349 RepID=A0ABW4AKY5_9ACTN|nr:FAD-binding oxidoreductase [Actinoplanes sichuanensis]BEL10430.1 FAD-binding oxidoreductase [Actinoplanes sichuanensis]
MSGSLLAELVEICGPGAARVARGDDRVAGRHADYVAAPATSQAVSRLLRLAAERGLGVRARGSGSKIDWGTRPERLDIIIDTVRLHGMWDHDGSSAIVAAGTPVNAVQSALARHGRRLVLDPPSPGATIGGVLAVNESGPLRHRFGSPAGQAVSVALVDPAGEIVDLAEWESPAAGVITSAVLPVEELPEARRWVVRQVSTPTEVNELATRIVAQEFALSAVEVDLPAVGAGSFAMLLEGSAGFVAAGAGRLAREMGASAVIRAEAPEWWGSYPFRPSDVALRLRVRSRDLHAVGFVLRDAVGSAVAVRGSVGAGVVHAVLPRGLSPARIGDIVAGLEQVLMARRGRAVIVTAPPDLADRIPMATPDDLF